MTDAGTRPIRNALAATLAMALAMAIACGAAAQNGTVSVPRREPIAIPPVLPTEEELRAPHTIDAEVRRLATQLGAPAWSAREDAMRRLMEAEFIDLRDLCALLGSDELSPEQRYRLLLVLRTRIVTIERGAVGISMETVGAIGGEPGGIRVTELLPDLPAEKVMRIGDLITHIDGRLVHHHEDLVKLVQTKQPGRDVTFTVRRARRDPNGAMTLDADGRIVRDTMEVTIKLGSASRLRSRTSGLPARPSVVEQQRLLEAQEAARRYAPVPRLVTVEGADRLRSVPAPGTLDPYQALRAIELERRQIDLGRLELTEGLRQEWIRRLNAILEQAQDPRLSDAARADLFQIARRFGNLMSD